jgi:tetratricopeptide (TPR) repeat protein
MLTRKFQVSIFSCKTLPILRICFTDVLPEATNEATKEPTPEEISDNENRRAVETPVEDLEVVSNLRNEQYSFNWSCVDVVGSPRLTRLIGALTIEEYGLSDDISSLDLASNSLQEVNISGIDLMDLCTGSDCDVDEEAPSTNVSRLARITTPANPSRIVKLLEAWTQPSLQFELYPFPTSSSKSRYDVPQYFSSHISLPRMSKSECLIKFRKLRQLKDVEISNLIDRMGIIASDLYNSRDYATAETWYRRIVTAKQRIKWHKPEQTLWACVHIPDCVLRQGRYSEVQQLHKDLHTKIEQILGSEHPISIWSRRSKGLILQTLGLPAEADGVYRQVLQIFLSGLGVNHRDTLLTLENLGLSLIQLRRYAEAQSLFETIISLRFQSMKAGGKVADFQIDVLWDMSFLSIVLDRDMKYDESERVLDYAQKLLGKATRMKCGEVYQYHCQRARNYRHQRRFDESETILRGFLRHHEDFLTSHFKSIVFQNLEDILFQTGRNQEGAYWLKKRYLRDRKSYGLLHHYAMRVCERLGLCYANQRRYHEARLFFESVIKEMTSSTEDPDSRIKCIQEVNAWMLKVEEMRIAASTTRILEPENFEVAELDMDEDVDWEEMGDVPDPLL